MIVGVDIGTQSLKAVVTDDDLQPVGEAASAYRPSFPRPGWAEQDPRLWEEALAPTIGRALEAAGQTPRSVQALGICGQLDGCLAVDREGHALGPCIIWMDRRAAAEVAGLPAKRVQSATGVILDATHMAAKARWLKRHAPERVAIRRFHQPVSYLVARLTGAHVLDHGLASTTMAYALRARRFDPGLLELFELDAAELPAIAEAFERAGSLHRRGAALTGLPEGIAVAVGTGDDLSNPLGAGLVEPGKLACALGTAEVVGALHDLPAIDRRGLVETHGYAGGRFFIENPGWLAGGALAWFVEAFRLRDAEELDTLAATAPAGCDGVTFLPALSGAMAPEWVAAARGCFYGLSAAHGSGHLARAVLEGCAFAMRDVLERLREMEVATHSILLLGGGARSRLWAQIRADLTGLSVAVPAVVDTSPLGAAVLAALAAGLQPDLVEAARRVATETTIVEPDAERREAYDDAYRTYRKLFDSLRPMFDGR
ncbi:MAG TPA: FGGY family carbohydrate kinase [Geminicoccaceae bacterium]|nr:FGGY family carbohydrate kinase [Geminicoccaceae bacterium]